MSKLRLNITMSLDGYVAGPDQSERHPLGVGGETFTSVSYLSQPSVRRMGRLAAR